MKYKSAKFVEQLESMTIRNVITIQNWIKLQYNTTQEITGLQSYHRNKFILESQQ